MDDTIRLREDDTVLWSTRLLVASVPRQLLHGRWTTPKRNCPSPTHLTCLLRAQSACCTPPASRSIICTSPLAASTSPTIACRPAPFFLRLGAEVYVRRVTDKHTGINPSSDQWRGLRLLKRAHRPAFTFAQGARPTFAGRPWTTGTAV